MKILVMGLPGSGKTIQAKKLSEVLGYCFIRMGDLLRELASQDSQLGRKVKSIMDAGELVDGSVTKDIVKRETNNPECQNGFVIEGYPRSIDQLKAYNPEFDKAFYLDVSEDILKKRLVERGRADDIPQVIERRIQVQKEQLGPLVDYFEKQNKLVRINGGRSIDGVYQQIMEHLR